VERMREQVRGTPGFAFGARLSREDLEKVNDLIVQQLAAQIERIAPERLDLFRNTPLEQYHSIAHLVPHSDLLTRTERILPQRAVDEIRATSLLRQLEAEFGKFAISDEEGMGRESISIRLVRPGMESDVGSLHADDWFWKLYHFKLSEGLQRVKVWVAICCEPGRSGLLLAPDSHKREWKYHTVTRAGMTKPMLDISEKPVLELFKSEPGDAVAFNYHLLHGGAVTRGSITRVSIEFTILVPEGSYFSTSAVVQTG